MGQNHGLPNMAAEEVGDTYYMIPIMIFYLASMIIVVKVAVI